MLFYCKNIETYVQTLYIIYMHTYGQIVHIFKSYIICSSHTYVQIIHMFKSYICSSHTYIQVIHMFKSYIYSKTSTTNKPNKSYLPLAEPFSLNLISVGLQLVVVEARIRNFQDVRMRAKTSH